MINKTLLFVLIALLASFSSFAQARTKAQRDSATFARLIMATKEFKQEKQKMDSVYKATGKVAVAAFEIQIDEGDDKPAKKAKDDSDEDDEKPAKKAAAPKPTAGTKPAAAEEDSFLSGTIIEQQGAANVVVYELKYDRKKHQITSIKPLSDGLDISVESE